MLSIDGLGLFPGESDDVGDGRFARQRLFRNVCRRDGEGVAGLREEFLAARRGGSEYQHRLIIAEGQSGHRSEMTGAPDRSQFHSMRVPVRGPSVVQMPQAMRGVLWARP